MNIHQNARTNPYRRALLVARIKGGWTAAAAAASFGIRKPGHRVTGSRVGRNSKLGFEYVHVCIDDHSRAALSRSWTTRPAIAVPGSWLGL